MKNAYDSMLQSNREAAQILSTYGCSACTDITGFGLMGHLLEMIKFDDNNNHDDQIIENDEEKEMDNGKTLIKDTSETENDNLNGHDNNNMKVVKDEVEVEVEVAVRLSIKAVPILSGATECINDGIFSSLQPQNIRCSRAVGNLHLGKLNNSYPLLYDPQVCTYVRTIVTHFCNLMGILKISSHRYCKNISRFIIQRSKPKL